MPTPANYPILAYDTQSQLLADTPAANTYGVVIQDTNLGLELNGYYFYNGSSWALPHTPFASFQQDLPFFGGTPSARLLQVKAQESVSVCDFGAGTTADDTSAFQSAVLALAPSGGDLIVPYNPNGYFVGDDAIVLDSSVNFGVHVIIQGGTVINYTGSTGKVITIAANVLSTAPKHRITGGVFQAQTPGSGTCIWIEDCGSHVIENVQAYGFEKAFAIHNHLHYSEHNTFMNCRAIGGKFAWWLSMDPGAVRSMATTTWIACSAAPDTNSPTTPPNVWYGLFIDSNVSIYRANFDGLTLFPATDYAVGMACNGSISSARGKLNCEDNSGGTAAHTAGILLGPDATGFSGHDISSDLRGVTDNYVQS